jgi:hypothetical protein
VRHWHTAGQPHDASAPEPWSLPASGVLGSISVKHSDEWRPLAATAKLPIKQWNHWTVDSLPSREVVDQLARTSHGRSVAATARVACRQLGYRAAPLVLPCSALILLEEAASENLGATCQPHKWTEIGPGEKGRAGGWVCQEWNVRCVKVLIRCILRNLAQRPSRASR